LRENKFPVDGGALCSDTTDISIREITPKNYSLFYFLVALKAAKQKNNGELWGNNNTKKSSGHQTIFLNALLYHQRVIRAPVDTDCG
jgi:hypothetical protein